MWEAPTPEEEKVLALESIFAEIKNKLTSKRQGKDDEKSKTNPTKKQGVENDAGNKINRKQHANSGEEIDKSIEMRRTQLPNREI